MVNAKTWNPAQIDQAIRRLEGIIRSGSYNPAELNQLLNQLGEPGYINTWNPAELDQKLRTLLHDLLTWKTATGNPIQLRTNNGGLVQSCEVTFSPIQSGSGDPSPTNIRPISGRDSVVLTRFGREKLSLSGEDTTTLNGVTIKRSGFCFVLSGTSTASTNFTYNLDETVNLNPSKNKIAFNNNFINNSIEMWFVRSTTRVHFWGFSSKNRLAENWTDSGNENVDNLQIKIASGVNCDGYMICPILCDKTTADYRVDHTATFPETVYGGSYDFVSGGGKAVRKIAKISDFDFTELSSAPIFRAKYQNVIPDVKAPTDVSVPANIISEQFTAKGYGPISAQDNGKFAISAWSVNRIIFIDNTVSDVTEFIQKYGDMKICYELATPTEITLTPEDIELLSGYNVLWTDGDSIEITYKKLLLPSDVESLSKNKQIKEKQKTTRSKKKKEE